MWAGSVIGSIALGEIAFHLQKKKKLADGQIELLRHYGLLGMGVGLSATLATETDAVVWPFYACWWCEWLSHGNKAYKQYSYTRGDVDAISSLSWIGRTRLYGSCCGLKNKGFIKPIVAPCSGWRSNVGYGIGSTFR